MIGWILFTQDPATSNTEPAPVKMSNDRRELEREAEELQAAGLETTITPAGQNSLFEHQGPEHKKGSRQESLLDCI